jgi:hypothetical protein
MTTEPIFKITDGTIEIDLLSGAFGRSLDSWIQQIINFKNGGTYRDNPLADQRRLVDTKWTNAIETLTLIDHEVDVDTLIESTQNLLRMLEKAVDYWTTDWQDEPVFFVARAACETNARYALIMNYRIPDLPNPYSQPFLQPDGERTWDSYDLIIERLHWTKDLPGVGESVALSAFEDYNGISYGNVDSSEVREPTTAEGEVFITNKRNEANITHIFRDDGGVFSANLVGGGVPFNLLPAAAIAVNDAVYFGINTALADSGPFTNIVLDIGTVGAGYSGSWQIWTGAAWTTLNPATGQVTDNTSSFTNSGVNSVVIDIETAGATWATTAVNAVTGYWLRFLVTAAPGGYISPTQQNRDVYSTIWPYTEIQADVIGGDIMANARLRIMAESAVFTSPGPLRNTAVNRDIIGLRSVSRGANFTAYLNYAQEQNPAGITALAGIDGSFISSTFAPSGELILTSFTGTSPTLPLAYSDMRIDSTILPEYKGAFRILYRMRQVGGSVGDVSIALRYRFRDTVGETFNEQQTDLQQPPAADEFLVIDFGTIEIPLTSLADSADTFEILQITVMMTNQNTTPDIESYDLILIPKDEWSGDFQGDFDDVGYRQISTSVDDSQYIDIDSITYPKQDIRAFIRNQSTDNTQNIYQSISQGHFRVQRESRQRLWFTGIEKTSQGSKWKPHGLWTVRIDAKQNYLGMRGNR